MPIILDFQCGKGCCLGLQIKTIGYEKINIVRVVSNECLSLYIVGVQKNPNTTNIWIDQIQANVFVSKSSNLGFTKFLVDEK
jgi:hypothetical protein